MLGFNFRLNEMNLLQVEKKPIDRCQKTHRLLKITKTHVSQVFYDNKVQDMDGYHHKMHDYDKGIKICHTCKMKDALAIGKITGN